MRFACQSCGKAYNLPEERIAEKSNVKLKCRVCGAIVEVKRQGELVAQVLDESDNKRVTRVSEAPPALTSITPEDEDDPEGATVSISEGSINDRDRPLLYEGTPFSSGLLSSGLEMPVVPGPPPTGFSAALSAGAQAPLPAAFGADAGAQRLDALNVAPPLPPPPLSPSSLPPPPPLRPPGSDALPNGASGGSVVTSVAAVTAAAHLSAPKLPQPGSPGGNLPMSNGSSNGASAFFPEASDDLTPELKAPVAPSGPPSATGNASAVNALPPAAISADLGDFPAPPSEQTGRDPMFKLKMLAAFATGVLIDRIISGLFQ